VLLQKIQRDDFQRPFMGGRQRNGCRHACGQAFEPARGTQAPPVARLESGKVVLGTRRGKVVTRRPTEFKELGGQFDADGMATLILRAGVAVAIAEKSGDGGERARFQGTAEDIARGLGNHSRDQDGAWLRHDGKERRRLSTFGGGQCQPRLVPTFMPTLYETIRADIVTAMKARDSATTVALRTADAGIKRAAMDANREIDDALTIATLRKAIKNLADAKMEFEKGGRPDLVAANETEIRVLEKYLPPGLGLAQMQELIDRAIEETGAQSKKEMGKVIGALKKHPDAGLIDFGIASKLVQEKLP